jgi:SAM-dependent methyltransferase
MERLQTENDIRRLRQGAEAFAVLAAWQNIGALDLLADGEPRALTELPGDLRALSITAPILVHMGVLATDGEGYALTITGRRLYEEGALPSLRNALKQLRPLADLGRILSEGGPATGPDGTSLVTSGGVLPNDREHSRRFLEMLFRTSAETARETARWAARHLPEGGHVLDLGGGHGRYAHELAERGFSCTIFDRPMVCELATERWGDRFAYVGGDFGVDPLGGPYDAALLSNIVHGEGPAANAELVERVYEALAPGGVLIIKDMFLDDLRAQPSSAAFFGLTMLLYTEQGQSYDLATTRRWCFDAGFESVESVFHESWSLVFARRPA